MQRYLILALILSTILCGCSSIGDTVSKVSYLDNRCQWNQYCIYTDAPPAIRTSVLRSTDPAVR